MAPLPTLPPELIIDEILLRLPPEEPEHLFRASLVCKSWYRLVTDHNFSRRYRVFHRTPPLLGYLRSRSIYGDIYDEEPKPCLDPTTSVSLAPIPHYREALDCHHGRVLLRAYDDDWYLIVWDPITGDQKRMPDPDAGMDWLDYFAAMCCSVSGCDHLDCHGGPFRVVFIGSEKHSQVKACVYSSETGAWSTAVTLPVGEVRRIQPRRGAIIGDEIYFGICFTGTIIKYNMRQNCMFMINCPPQDDSNFGLMEMEDGSLGFAGIQGSKLYLWSRKVDSEGPAEWVQCKVVELGEEIFVDKYAAVLGTAEGLGIIFVGTIFYLFTIKLDSGQFKKIAKGPQPQVDYYSILPFMSFYTPVLCIFCRLWHYHC